MLLQPFALNTHATAAPVGAASMSDANGACITSLSVKAAGWTSAACVMNMPAHAAATLQSSNFPKPKSIMCLPLRLFRIWYPMQKTLGSTVSTVASNRVKVHGREKIESINSCRVSFRSGAWTYKSGASILSILFLSIARGALAHST